MKKIEKDLTIIGGGPGGYVAGPMAAAAGLSVACVEKEVLGGVCLKWGCMPTKSLASVSHRIDILNHLETYGISGKGFSLDFSKVMERTGRHVAALESGCVSKFSKMGIDLHMGFGSLHDDKTVLVEPKEGEPFLIESKNILIDTGSVSVEVPPFAYDDPDILSNRGILSLKELPGSILIIGGGVMGCEFANIFSNFGVKITMVEMLPRLLATVDEDVSALIQADFEKRGIEMHFNTCVESYRRTAEGFECKLADGNDIKAEKVLVVVGRKPNTSGLNLEKAGIRTGARGQILVDECLRTSASSIYAVGDVIGGTLAHVSRLEGEIVARHILGEKRTMDYDVVPWSIFTSLEISGVGLTEQEAKKRGIEYRSTISPFKSNGKALVSDEYEGFVKTLIEESGKILGAQIIGPHSSDLIHELALAKFVGATAEDIGRMIHVHPTLAEAVLKTAQQLA